MKTFFLALLVFVGLFGCRQKDAPALLSNAESYMLEHPDSALLLLQSTSVSQFHNKADRAKYAFLYSQALDKNYIDLESDSLIRIAVDFYNKHGSPGQKAWATFYQARVFENAHDIERAIELFLKAEAYIKGYEAYLS